VATGQNFRVYMIQKPLQSYKETIVNKILLTSVCKPIGPRHGDASSVGYELLFGQVTLAQGIFSPRAVHLQYGLEYIAENLDTPTTVLQYPSKKRLIRELKKGYEYIGVSFVLSTYHRMKEVVQLIRQYSPQSKIVLGGYGTVIEDELLTPYCDHICREEGVGFMKKLLGESGVEPLRHPVIISKLKIFSVPVNHTGLVFAGLGCPNGCDFCCTSFFFKRRHIRLLNSGKDIFRVIESYQNLKENIKITILDEDFLLNRKRVMEFAQAVRESERTFSIFCFASIRALSQYKIEELVAMGIDGLWIGVEGRHSDFAKQSGQDVTSLFAKLRSAGILVLASMIVGFDYQTKETIKDELNDLLEKQPTLSQFLIYGPTPGTPFYDRIMRENRLRPDLACDRLRYFHQCTGFDALVTHPTLSSEEIRQMQQYCFREDFRRLGPSIIRSLECYLNGYLHWRNHRDPMLRKKSMAFYKDFIMGIPVLPIAGILGPSYEARKKAWSLLYRGMKETSIPWIRSLTLALLAIPPALWTGFKLKTHLFQHPRVKSTTYPGNILQSLCQRFGGKNRGSLMELNLVPLQNSKFQKSLQMLHLKGILDQSTLKQFFRELKQHSLSSLNELVIDLRNLDVLHNKHFLKLLRKLDQKKVRISVLLSQDKFQRIKEETLKFQKNLVFFLSEEGLLTATAK
jgi:hypothetical protein